ncbi:MAG: cytochrome c3 family protein [Flavobacteriaceae bacterium]|nr:cytochrome c3 family protein [Flavobacteriaceae bacterium]
MKTSIKSIEIMGLRNFITKVLFILFIINLQLHAQEITTEKTCVDCHSRTVKNKIVHGPTATDCLICHIPNGKKHPVEDEEGFTLLYEGAALCYSCHEEARDVYLEVKYIHDPVKKGDCMECHEVHSSNDSNLIFAKSPDLCYFCHDELESFIKKSKIVHTPATKEGGCVNCHSPHSSSIKKILLKNEKALCLECHNETIKVDKREISNIEKLIRESEFKHEALDDGCTVCHNPHASENLYLLNVPYPTKNYAEGTEENYDLCFGCHDADLLLLEKTKYATEFRNGEQNLHYIHINKKKGRTCVNCHSIHGSSRDHLVPETVKFGSWDMPLKYIATEQGGTCLSGCHKEQSYSREL